MDLFPVPSRRNAEAAAILALVGASEKQEHLPEHRLHRGTNTGEVRAPWSCPLRQTDFPVQGLHRFLPVPGFWLGRPRWGL